MCLTLERVSAWPHPRVSCSCFAACPVAMPGVKYRFGNTEREGWIGRGRRRAVVLSKPRIVKRDDTDALQLEAAELQRQIDSNAALSGGERQMLVGRMQQLQARVAAIGAVQNR